MSLKRSLPPCSNSFYPLDFLAFKWRVRFLFSFSFSCFFFVFKPLPLTCNFRCHCRSILKSSSTATSPDLKKGCVLLFFDLWKGQFAVSRSKKESDCGGVPSLAWKGESSSKLASFEVAVVVVPMVLPLLALGGDGEVCCCWGKMGDGGIKRGKKKRWKYWALSRKTRCQTSST